MLLNFFWCFYKPNPFFLIYISSLESSNSDSSLSTDSSYEIFSSSSSPIYIFYKKISALYWYDLTFLSGIYNNKVNIFSNRKFNEIIIGTINVILLFKFLKYYSYYININESADRITIISIVIYYDWIF